MTEYGTFRDGFPRITLSLPGQDGEFDVEFIVDTGFDGDLTLPEALARQLPNATRDNRLINLAGAFRQRCSYYEILWTDEEGEARTIEVLVLEGNPLIGTQFLVETRLTIELTEGGEVVTEAL